MIKRRIAVVVCCLILGSASYGCGRAASPLEPVTPQAVAADAQPVVIDTDMAADDWMAILYLLGRTDIAVKAITVSGTGEAHCVAGTENALDLLALAGRPQIPVTCGREAPLSGNHSFPADWRERVDDLLGLTLPASRSAVSNTPAAEMLSQIVRDSPQKLRLIALGPLTNVGEALENDPGLATNLAAITVMGGALDVAGNVGPSSGIDNQNAEWNIYVDPRAAAEVFSSGAPVTLVPLDATDQAPLTMDFYRRLESDRATSVSEFVYRVLTAKVEEIRAGGYYFWDPLAAAIATDAGLSSFEQLPLVVVDEEGPQSGRTLEANGGSMVRVAETVERAAFEQLFLDAVNGRLP